MKSWINGSSNKQDYSASKIALSSNRRQIKRYGKITQSFSICNRDIRIWDPSVWRKKWESIKSHKRNRKRAMPDPIPPNMGKKVTQLVKKMSATLNQTNRRKIFLNKIQNYALAAAAKLI